MFVMNQYGHYFQIDAAKVAFNSSQFHDCVFFEKEQSMLVAVCEKTGCELDEVEGSTFFITKRAEKHVMFDDRGFEHVMQEPVEEFVSTYML